MKKTPGSENYSRFLEQAKSSKEQLAKIKELQGQLGKILAELNSHINYLEAVLTTPGFIPEDPIELQEDQARLAEFKEIESRMRERFSKFYEEEQEIERDINSLKGAHLAAAKLLKKYNDKTIH
jgi:DNA repair ATPase RecN